MCIGPVCHLMCLLRQFTSLRQRSVSRKTLPLVLFRDVRTYESRTWSLGFVNLKYWTFNFYLVVHDFGRPDSSFTFQESKVVSFCCCYYSSETPVSEEDLFGRYLSVTWHELLSRSFLGEDLTFFELVTLLWVRPWINFLLSCRYHLRVSVGILWGGPCVWWIDVTFEVGLIYDN